jgi:hypothetical protein
MRWDESQGYTVTEGVPPWLSALRLTANCEKSKPCGETRAPFSLVGAKGQLSNERRKRLIILPGREWKPRLSGRSIRRASGNRWAAATTELLTCVRCRRWPPN